MKSFRADYVFTIDADPIKNGVVTVDDQGRITRISAEYEPVAGHVEQLSGIICPGFVNSHCHLELSHLKDKVPQSTGLVDFIKNVQQFRAIEAALITEAAIAADETMYQQGIVAVGDICNSNITIPIKAKSKLYYHSFIEVFGFLPDRSEAIFNDALQLLKQFKPAPCSITPHAPYSVSKELFRLIKAYADENDNLLSMHNQESDEENKFYRYKLGKFLELYETFGIDISYFKPQARNSIQSVLPLLSNKQRVLLVHNTCTNLKDIYFIKRFDRNVHWCFCPNANLYIEGRLPKINLFIDQGYDIMLGTDSLASNAGLSILSEMQTIQNHFPAINLTQMLTWATLNGAKFLGIDSTIGSITVGKKPGLNLITETDGFKLTPESQVKRLI